MDIYSIIERVRPFFLPSLLGVVGLGFLFYGFITLNHPKTSQNDIVFEAAVTNPKPDITTAKKITVDIEGGVVKPGVYSLPAESRIQDAVMRAGGMSGEANHPVIAKTLNLAAKLTDGAKIYIPTQGEPVASGLATATGDSSSQTVLGSETINLNTASAKDLDTLPGIGMVTAQKIIGSRPYASVDELVSKKIISKKVFDQIKEKVSIY